MVHFHNGPEWFIFCVDIITKMVHFSNMKLKEYLEKTQCTYEEFAQRIGVKTSSARRYAVGLRIPKPHIMQRIVVVTGGLVTPNSFYTNSEA